MHNAIISKVDRLQEVPKADKIQVAYVLGEAVIVGKGVKVGDVGVFFQPELQLSEAYCHYNNLNRDAEKNIIKTQTGFFDTNRKVRAQPFMKIRSEGYFAELDSLAYLIKDTGKTVGAYFKVGDSFDTVEGQEICRKYISPQTQKLLNNAPKDRKIKVKPQAPLFAEHVKTDHFKYVVGNIPEGTVLSFHAKLHGTSGRYAHTIVEENIQGWWKKLINKLQGGDGKVRYWDYLMGTRRVVKFQKDGEVTGYHGPEQWRMDILEELKPYLGKGLAVYGEIVGYTNGKPIMGVHNTKTLKDKKFTKKYGENMTYTYGCNEGQCDFYIYRIVQSLPSGDTYEMTPSQVIKWAKDRGFKHTLRVCEDIIYEGDMEALREKVRLLTERPEVMCEDFIDPSHVSEGIVIRVDGEKMTPKFLKSKSTAFRIMEGIYTENNVDMEDAS